MAETVEKVVGKLISKKREELGYNRKELAYMSGVPYFTIYKWETGAGGKMRPGNAAAIEKALGLEAGCIHNLYNEYNPNSKVTPYRKFRLINGMTIYDAAKKLGVCADTILNWELGRSDPTGFMLMAMARLYNTTPNDLLDFKHYETVYGS